MKNNNLSKFENNGFLLQKNIFSETDLKIFEIEFDIAVNSWLVIANEVTQNKVKIVSKSKRILFIILI